MAKSKISAVHVALGVGALGALYLLTRKSAEKSAAEQHADAILAGQNRTGGWRGYSVIGAGVVPVAPPPSLSPVTPIAGNKTFVMLKDFPGLPPSNIPDNAEGLIVEIKKVYPDLRYDAIVGAYVPSAGQVIRIPPIGPFRFPRDSMRERMWLGDWEPFGPSLSTKAVADKLRTAGYPEFAQRIEARHRSSPIVDGSRNLPLASWLKKSLILLGLWDGDTSENWNNPSKSGPTLLQTLAALQRSRYLMTKSGQQAFAPNGHFDAAVLDAIVGRLNEKGYLSLVPLPAGAIARKVW